MNKSYFFWINCLIFSLSALANALPLQGDFQANEEAANAVIEVTAENFDSVILDSTRPVILMVYAEWCGGCRYFKPILKNLNKQYGHLVQFAKLNYDKQYDLAARYPLAYLPTFIFFRHGFIINQTDDVNNQNELESLIKELIEQVEDPTALD